jgi:membrane associated rhomboid family serine protease
VATSVQTCYRHADRRAGVRCQRCERPICPQCMTQASVGFHCPECTRGAGQKVITARSLRPTRPVVTVTLVAVNLFIFAAEMLAGGGGTSVTGGWADPASWRAEGALFGPLVAAGEWWRPVTAGFLHANLMHVGFNMFLLWQLGHLLEPAVKRIPFAVLYVMSLVGGSFLVLVISPNQVTVGASGAVFGLMGAAFVAMRSRGIDPFQTGVGPLIVLNLVITFIVPGISIGGHIGGLAAGALGGWLLWVWAPTQQRSVVVPTVICAALAAGLFAASLAIA